MVSARHSAFATGSRAACNGTDRNGTARWFISRRVRGDDVQHFAETVQQNSELIADRPTAHHGVPHAETGCAHRGTIPAGKTPATPNHCLAPTLACPANPLS